MNSARDEGFILLESIIAITVITVIMSAVGAEFVAGMITSNQQRAQQIAVQVADSAVEQVRSLNPSDLVTGRDATSVSTQFAAGRLNTQVQPWLATMDAATDTKAAAGKGTTASIPTIGVTQQPASLVYTVNDYLGTCTIPSTSNNCVAPSTLSAAVVAAGTTYLRAVVAVTWTGNRCGSLLCTYVTATLISTASDQTFRVNSAPYTAPVIIAPGAQSNAIGDTVSLKLNVQNGTGVPLFTWAITTGSLPAGLGLSTDGTISGTVGGAAGSFSVTVQVTDAFLRTDTQVVTWTVKAALVYADPGPQASTTSAAISNLTLVPSGGDGAPYTFTDANSTLPPGLTMTSAGVISGKATAVGTYNVQIKLTDKSGTRFYTNPFTWTVTTPPLAVSVPSTQTSTLSTAISGLQLTASGGSGTYTWADASPRTLPAGLTLNTTTGKITGTPTATGQSTVKITVSDGSVTQTATFTWVVTARPTVTSPGNQTSSVGASVNVQLTTTCPNSACTYAFGGIAPSGLAISSTGVINGTVGTTVKTFTGITVIVTDAAGATTTSATFTWTVNAAPAMASPGNQTTQRGAAVSLDVSTLDSGGTSPYTFGASGLPTWLTINATTGKITGTAPAGANSTTSGITVSVTDASGVTATSSTFIWNVTNLANSIDDVTVLDNKATSINVGTLTTGGTSPYTYTATGLPTWLTINATTGVLSGTSPNLTNASTKSTAITVTVTDSKGAVVTPAVFYVFNSDIVWSLPATISTARGTNLTGTGTTAASYVSGGASAKTYSATGLPTGLSMATNGTVSGTTSTNGTYTTVITVVDSVGATVSAQTKWTVS